MKKPSRRTIWITVAVATAVLGGALAARSILFSGCATRTRIVRALDDALDLDEDYDRHDVGHDHHDHDRHVDD